MLGLFGDTIIVGATGHRPDKLNGDYLIQTKYMRDLRLRVMHWLTFLRPVRVVTGVAVGFDMIVATAALHLKIPHTAAIPFIGQEAKWPPAVQELYYRIINHELTTKVIVCEGGYENWKLQKRNEYIVDNTNVLLSLWNGIKKGGTWNCLEYALGRTNIITMRPPIAA